jgi:hypothetical protein
MIAGDRIIEVDPMPILSATDHAGESLWLSVFTSVRTVPETRLMAHILLDAIYMLDKPPLGILYREAVEWFQDPTEDYVFSFRQICQTFNLSPTRVLRELKPKLDRDKEAA